MAIVINLAYIVASILFIFGIKMMGQASSARQGNRLSAGGMLIAVVATLIHQQVFDSWLWIAAGLLLGGGIGAIAAQRVEMTGMPELVALFNGFGGLASLFVGWAEYQHAFDAGETVDLFTAAVVFLAVLIGGITFTGSIYAWGKLSGRVSGSPILFPGQKIFNGSIMAIIVALGIAFAFDPTIYLVFIVGVGLALLLGILGVMPIGGGDMPVVVSLLNSFSGLAASAAGFVIQNNVLVVAGCLVGASGLILTIIMCKAMNRTLANVLFGGFGAAVSGGTAVEGEMKAASIDDAYFVLEAARNVVFVPGYGMAVAQAQHVVKELGQILEDNGAEVRYVVHPVAGRMPGHMNVLLAEADVPYEQLVEMEDVNPTINQVDVAIVIGANDVVNPAALTDESSPIYGMPIINVHEARTVYALKRGRGRGFSGIVNALFFSENTRMLFGDAKQTIGDLVAHFKE
ncbi:MAG: NAD(P)(+) transhydrogenase (Re/Si-specific) subunit beta [Ardenticatenaceae bacterium]|nr:NAD(P)(+) transhydrogenase (Re/Si-specific) subunit beta [Ardenticatenaceae bacterium]